MRAMLALPLFIAGCVSFPTLEGTIDEAAREAPYPTLSPLPTLRMAPADELDDLNARIAALQLRADRLRRIDFASLQ